MVECHGKVFEKNKYWVNEQDTRDTRAPAFGDAVKIKKQKLNFMKKAYYFLFYKFYQFGERSPSIFPRDLTASFAVSCLELVFLMSLKVYYFDFIDQTTTFKPKSVELLLSLIVILSINSYMFLIDKRWKDYIKTFNKLPEKTNNLGTWVVVFIVIVVFFNLVFAFYKMSQITGHH